MPIGQKIEDQAETAYTEGAVGFMYFLYWAGGSNYEPYTLVDINGNDTQGKWDAVRTAAGNIRRWEGSPTCTITSPERYGWPGLPATIKLSVSAPSGDPVKVVKGEISLDRGLTWTPLHDVAKPPYEYTVDAGMVKGADSCMVRVRAMNTRGSSLWDVIEIGVL